MIVVGLFSPLVAIPLMRISKAAPGAPEVVVTFTPETVPCKACSILTGFKASKVLLSTTETAPVTSRFF